MNLIDTKFEVFWGSEVVGTLSAESRVIKFSYSDFWLSHNKPAISISLPLAKNCPSEAANNFFANLLPEGDFRKKLEIIFKISAGNDFSLLAQLGEDCAGALSIGRKPKTDEGFYEDISDDLLVNFIRSEGASGFRGKNVTRLSLAGAQGKLPIAIINDTLKLPQKGAPSTHIMKFNKSSGAFPRLAENEYYIGKIAQCLGLNTVESTLRIAGEHVVYITKRYDRCLNDSWPKKLHQEDFCQALAISPLHKYQKEGGPSAKDCFELAKQHLTLKEINQMLDWLLFNWLIGNSDAHAKNISFLYPNSNEILLAPFYDMVCTRSYPSIDRNMAMAMGEAFDPNQVSNKNLKILANDIGITLRFVNSRLKSLIKNLPEAINQAKLAMSILGVNAEKMQHVFLAVEKTIKINSNNL